MLLRRFMRTKIFNRNETRCHVCLILYQAWYCGLRFIFHSLRYQSYLINCVESVNLTQFVLQVSLPMRQPKDFISNAQITLSACLWKRRFLSSGQLFKPIIKNGFDGSLWHWFAPVLLLNCTKKIILWKGHNQRWNLLFDIFLWGRTIFVPLYVKTEGFTFQIHTRKSFAMLFGGTVNKGRKFNTLLYSK